MGFLRWRGGRMVVREKRRSLPGSSDGYFSDFYHHLLRSSWPLLLFQVACALVAINAAFATCYLIDGGVANARPGSFADDARIHVVFAQQERTAEGEEVRRFHDLELKRYRNAIFAYSWTAIHPIRPGSPFFGARREALIAADADLTVSLTGIDETFSQTVYARHSYNAEDLVWGARLADITAYAGRRVRARPIAFR
jgi:hypothetical protein